MSGLQTTVTARVYIWHKDVPLLQIREESKMSTKAKDDYYDRIDYEVQEIEKKEQSIRELKIGVVDCNRTLLKLILEEPKLAEQVVTINRRKLYSLIRRSM